MSRTKLRIILRQRLQDVYIVIPASKARRACPVFKKMLSKRFRASSYRTRAGMTEIWICDRDTGCNIYKPNSV